MSLQTRLGDLITAIGADIKALQTKTTIKVTSIAYAASITPNCATTDIAEVGTLTGNITINAPTGTPVDGQNLRFRFTQGSTSRTFTWNSAYAFGTDVTAAMVPSTINLKFEIIFTWHAGSSKWRCTGIVRGFA